MMRFFGKRPRATEAPAWVEILARGMGLILKKQDAQMGQIENFNSALSQLRAQFDALRDDVKANQTPKEPDLSSQISQLQDMANEAASIRATLAGDATQSGVQTAPASEQPTVSSDSVAGATTSAAGTPAV
jgi:uncharacterized protein with von Willebrand factor type A (vWA) domain